MIKKKKNNPDGQHDEPIPIKDGVDSGGRMPVEVSWTIEKGDSLDTKSTKIYEGLKKFIGLTSAHWALKYAKEGDFDPLLGHLKRGGDVPAEMKDFIASMIDALLQRKSIRKSKPITAKIDFRNLRIACFVLQLENWGVPPGRAKKAASEKFCLNVRSVEDIARKRRDEARDSLEISKLVFGSLDSSTPPEKPQKWELATWGLTEGDIAALAAPQRKGRSR